MRSVHWSTVAEAARPIGSDFALLERTGSGPAIAAPWGVATLLETGRQALAMVADALGPAAGRSIAAPAFACRSMLDPFLDRGWGLLAYPVDADLRPDLAVAQQLAERGAVAAVLVIRYFGAVPSDEDRAHVATIRTLGTTVIADDTHMPFSGSRWGADFSIASLRKVLPVPDGAYVVTDVDLSSTLVAPPRETGRADAMASLDANDVASPSVRRALDAATHVLEESDAARSISRRGRATLAALDLAALAAARRRNAATLTEALPRRVELAVHPDSVDVPSHVPIRVAEPRALQRQLARERIYCPIHWPRPPGFATDDAWPDGLLSLPIDHRYEAADMHRIASELARSLR